MKNEQKNLLPLGAVARKFHVPPKWLRAEAEAGKIPHLKADRQILFIPDIVEQLLIERAGKGGKL